MNQVLSLLLFPLLVGILSGLLMSLFMGIVRFDQENWHKILSIVIGACVSLLVARINYKSDLCEKEERLASETVELMPRITHAAIYEIDASNVCRKRDGSPSYVNDPAAGESYEVYRSNVNLFNFKMIPLFKKSQNVYEAYNNYGNALMELEDQCRKNPGFAEKELRRKESVVIDTNAKLVHALGEMIVPCYR